LNLEVVELIKKQYYNLGAGKKEIGKSHAGKNRRSSRKNLEVAGRKG
jgi:hypothetical protein